MFLCLFKRYSKHYIYGILLGIRLIGGQQITGDIKLWLFVPKVYPNANKVFNCWSIKMCSPAKYLCLLKRYQNLYDDTLDKL